MPKQFTPAGSKSNVSPDNHKNIKRVHCIGQILYLVGLSFEYFEIKDQPNLLLFINIWQ